MAHYNNDDDDNNNNAASTNFATTAPRGTATQAEQQAVSYMARLKNYSLLIEYKKLKVHAPNGVYVTPSLRSLRIWDGVIFVRNGHYRGGIFKFVLNIPDAYPDEGPTLRFIPAGLVFNPLVDPSTGLVDLSIEFPQWNPKCHYIVLVLAYLKRLFYKHEWWLPRTTTADGSNSTATEVPPFNSEAQQLWVNRKVDFLKRCKKCAEESVERVHVDVHGPSSALVFPKPTYAHSEVLRRILATDRNRMSNNHHQEAMLLTPKTGNGAARPAGAADATASTAGTALAGKADKSFISWFSAGVHKITP